MLSARDTLFSLVILAIALLLQFAGGKPFDDYLAVESELGKEFGISPGSTVDQATIQTILAGVEAGNKNSIYFFALYKLHGIALSKNTTVAALNFQRAADLGHAEATTAYAVMRLYGQGLEQDYSDAHRYLRLGVARNDMNAHYFLGRMLMEGLGLPAPKVDEAFPLLSVAAVGNVPQADHYLGVCYEYGLGTAQDFEMAMSHYQRAATQHQIESTYHLALMHAYGRGTKQDFRMAFQLLDSGARLAHAPSVFYIGIFHLYGYGMEPNYDKALNWFQRAAVSGDDRVAEQALAAAQELREKMDAARDENEETMQQIRELSDR